MNAVPHKVPNLRLQSSSYTLTVFYPIYSTQSILLSMKQPIVIPFALCTMQTPISIATVVTSVSRWIQIINTSLPGVRTTKFSMLWKLSRSISFDHNSFTLRLYFHLRNVCSTYCIFLLELSITSLCWRSFTLLGAKMVSYFVPENSLLLSALFHCTKPKSGLHLNTAVTLEVEVRLRLLLVLIKFGRRPSRNIQSAVASPPPASAPLLLLYR